MTYQELAAYLRSEYSPTYGGEEWRDDILLVEDYMTVRPDAMDWDTDISNFNELQGLGEEGDPLPVAGYGKQALYTTYDIGTLIPQAVAAETAEEIQKGTRREVPISIDPDTGEERVIGAGLPWKGKPEDREETWKEWFFRGLENIGRSSMQYTGSPTGMDLQIGINKALQQRGLMDPDEATKAIRETEELLSYTGIIYLSNSR